MIRNRKQNRSKVSKKTNKSRRLKTPKFKIVFDSLALSLLVALGVDGPTTLASDPLDVPLTAVTQCRVVGVREIHDSFKREEVVRVCKSIAMRSMAESFSLPRGESVIIAMRPEDLTQFKQIQLDGEWVMGLERTSQNQFTITAVPVTPRLGFSYQVVSPFVGPQPNPQRVA